jgi:hypothetical protein
MDHMCSEYIDVKSLSEMLVKPFLPFVQNAPKIIFCAAPVSETVSK